MSTVISIVRFSQVEEVRSVKEELQTQKRDYLSKKLQEAELKRQQQLKKVVKKAHEEGNKVRREDDSQRY